MECSFSTQEDALHLPTCMCPSPPFLRGVLVQAKWHSSVSVEAAINWQFKSANSFARSENAIISVGHTKVKSCSQCQRGQPPKTCFLYHTIARCKPDTYEYLPSTSLIRLGSVLQVRATEVFG
eukprot:3386468-Pyramimonas_sp.AAC.2